MHFCNIAVLQCDIVIINGFFLFDFYSNCKCGGEMLSIEKIQISRDARYTKVTDYISDVELLMIEFIASNDRRCISLEDFVAFLAENGIKNANKPNVIRLTDKLQKIYGLIKKKKKSNKKNSHGAIYTLIEDAVTIARKSNEARHFRAMQQKAKEERMKARAERHRALGIGHFAPNKKKNPQPNKVEDKKAYGELSIGSIVANVIKKAEGYKTSHNLNNKNNIKQNNQINTKSNFNFYKNGRTYSPDHLVAPMSQAERPDGALRAKSHTCLQALLAPLGKASNGGIQFLTANQDTNIVRKMFSAFMAKLGVGGVTRLTKPISQQLHAAIKRKFKNLDNWKIYLNYIVQFPRQIRDEIKFLKYILRFDVINQYFNKLFQVLDKSGNIITDLIYDLTDYTVIPLENIKSAIWVPKSKQRDKNVNEEALKTELRSKLWRDDIRTIIILNDQINSTRDRIREACEQNDESWAEFLQNQIAKMQKKKDEILTRWNLN